MMGAAEYVEELDGLRAGPDDLLAREHEAEHLIETSELAGQRMRTGNMQHHRRVKEFGGRGEVAPKECLVERGGHLSGRHFGSRKNVFHHRTIRSQSFGVKLYSVEVHSAS